MTEKPILEIRDLRVSFRTPDGDVEAVRGVDLDLHPGETVAVVGESGSGKSQLVMSTIGLLASNGTSTGSARYRGTELIGLSNRQLNAIRGVKISMIFQEPMTSLDPLQSIETQIGDPLIYHKGISRKDAGRRVLELLHLVGIPDPQARMGAFPHQLSGGQRQRVLIAMALANEPDIIIADEPTTALDVTIQAQILELLADLQRRFNMGLVFITHDLGIVRRFADRVYVMRRGVVVEQGEASVIMTRPAHPYTRELLDAEPDGTKAPVGEDEELLLDARGVRVTFPISFDWLGRVTKSLDAVGGISLAIRRGQTVGVVGESGSGKSTLGRAILRLLPSKGTIVFASARIDRYDDAEMRPLRRHMQVVFQDPFGSLSPRLTVGQIVAEGLRLHEPVLREGERQARVVEVMNRVGLDPSSMQRYPHEFSGGQRQRIAIARAMVLRPEFVLLDEPTSALDRTIQKQVIALLRDLQESLGLTYLFISHDLAVVRAMSDWVIVMKNGRVVEQGPSADVFNAPREPYTRTLLAAAVEGKVEKAG
ncbi:MAG: ABC transporter ATP-binding protein [Geminicoccaceae bacterium]|nr:ABC transporter ATP-binding protein [Geminicoccaceae bacterium]